MPRRFARWLFTLILLSCPTASSSLTAAHNPQNPKGNKPKLELRTERTSFLDLEVAGNLVGLSPATKRYVRREDLLALPQVSFAVDDDANFAQPATISGVDLDLLARELAADGEQAYIVAVCKDWYRGHFPRDYREIHRPVLALKVNDQPPSGWPERKDIPGSSMAPYLITHQRFTPSFKILAHEDEPQIPWGVVRLEFMSEKAALAGIAPQGPSANAPDVQAGYHIAQQNCFRCHGPDSDEPLKGKLIWAGIGLFASLAPRNFAAYVHDPQALTKDSQMPPNPEYDANTLQALISYFRTFAAAEKR